PDADLVEVTINDVGHHRRPFAQYYISDRVGDWGAPHHAVGVDRAVPRGLLQFGFVAEAERANRTRIVVQRATGTTFADHQLALFGRLPECLRFNIGLWGLDPAFLALHLPHSRSMMTVAAPCLVPSEPPVPCANARSQFFT